jgi:hypothetical protein
MVLRALDVLGAVRLCPTSHPEKCLDAFRSSLTQAGQNHTLNAGNH